MTLSGDRVESHGHRGARGLRPENTLPGIAAALEIGVDAIEVDAGLSADGVVVLNHDQELSAVNAGDTGPAWPGDPLFPYVGRRLDELTLEQIRTVDAGTRRGADTDPFMSTQLPVPGTRPATLAEACALAAEDGRVRLAVELKTDPGWPDAAVARFVRAVAAVLETYGMVPRGRLLAFDWRVLAAARKEVPKAGRGALVQQESLAPGAGWIPGLDGRGCVAAAVAAGATYISPEWPLATAELVREAHRAGLPVSVWTVNDPDAMALFIEYGVDAIVTDYPDRLRTIMAGRGLSLPPSRPADRVS